MSVADNSSGSYTNRLAAKAMAVFNKNPPLLKYQGGNSSFDQTQYLTRVLGEQVQTIQTTANPPYEVPACCADVVNVPICLPPGQFTNVSFNNIFYEDPFFYYEVTWDPVPNATSYNITMNFTPNNIVFTGQTSANIGYDGTGVGSSEVTFTARNACGTTVYTTDPGFPCFLAGSLVAMADGSTKAIEDVIVGDVVIGAFGEANVVLALHRPLLGLSKMAKINSEHSTTSHHPHVSVDKKFYTIAEPSVVMTKTYGRSHKVINDKGEEVDNVLHGLKEGRVHKLETGVVLKTIEGERVVSSFETYEMKPDTQLYNLVVGGSHTYHVDGYAVTGWPREDDFNYDTWEEI
jgi:hypothetical protein